MTENKIVVSVNPFALMERRHAGPLYAPEARELWALINDPNRDARYDEHTLRYAEIETDQDKLAEAVTEAWERLIKGLAVMFGFGFVSVVEWTADPMPGPEETHTPLGDPWLEMTVEQFLRRCAADLFCVHQQGNGVWSVATPAGVVFEL